jgi:hypothetical protein
MTCFRKKENDFKWKTSDLIKNNNQKMVNIWVNVSIGNFMKQWQIFPICIVNNEQNTKI